MAKKPAVKRAKKPAVAYVAAGFNSAGVDQIIRDAEGKRRGLVGYPWSTKLKAEMKRTVEGLPTLAEINTVIDALAQKETRKAV